jgi:hypothetical protein
MLIRVGSDSAVAVALIVFVLLGRCLFEGHPHLFAIFSYQDQSDATSSPPRGWPSRLLLSLPDLSITARAFRQAHSQTFSSTIAWQ